MQGDPDVIRALNAVLTNELTAVNQYFLHARMFQHWGFYRLGKIVYDESIDEMHHADWLTQRILFLDGLPNLQDLHKLAIGETVPEALVADLALERRSRVALVEGITLAEQRTDYVSRDLFKTILKDTEEHLDYLETQVGLIEALGVQNYLQSAVGSLDEGKGQEAAPEG
jgi:bacterioferritin